MGPVRGGLAIGTIGLMAIIAAMNGLSVAGMAIGNTLALPEMLKRKYDKVMLTGVIQAGSSLGIMIPPSVVLVLYGMIARQPVGRLVYRIHLYQMSVSASPGAGLTKGRTADAPGKEAAAAPGRVSSFSHYFSDVGTLLHGGNQSGREFSGRCDISYHCRSRQPAAILEGNA